MTFDIDEWMNAKIAAQKSYEIDEHTQLQMSNK